MIGVCDFFEAVYRGLIRMTSNLRLTSPLAAVIDDITRVFNERAEVFHPSEYSTL